MQHTILLIAFFIISALCVYNVYKKETLEAKIDSLETHKRIYQRVLKNLAYHFENDKRSLETNFLYYFSNGSFKESFFNPDYVTKIIRDKEEYLKNTLELKNRNDYY